MKGWPKKDADYILYFEIVLISLIPYSPFVLSFSPTSKSAGSTANTPLFVLTMIEEISLPRF